MAMPSKHVYEVRPRRDHRAADLISNALPFGRLRCGEPGHQAFVRLYSAAFFKGGRLRNELLAVAGTSHAFVIGSKSLNQCACRTWRKKPAADWGNYQASNQRVGVGDRLCNSR